VRPSGTTHQDSGSSNAFREIAYLSFNFAFVIGQFGLFSCQLLDQVEKLLIRSVGHLCRRRNHSESSREQDQSDNRFHQLLRDEKIRATRIVSPTSVSLLSILP